MRYGQTNVGSLAAAKGPLPSWFYWLLRCRAPAAAVPLVAALLRASLRRIEFAQLGAVRSSNHVNTTLAPQNTVSAGTKEPHENAAHTAARRQNPSRATSATPVRIARAPRTAPPTITPARPRSNSPPTALDR